MDLIRVASFARDQNISSLSLYLLKEGIKHEIVEDTEGQHLFVVEDKAEQVVDFIRGLQGENVAGGTRSRSTSPWHQVLQVWPVTFAAVVLGAAGYFLTRFDQDFSLVGWFTFTDIQRVGLQLHMQSFAGTYLEQSQWWRLLTPAFLHFGFIHILFNGLLIWELGRRLEFFIGPKLYLLVFVVIGVLANVVQFLVTGPVVFGGLSGVVFGFLGMIAVFYRRLPHPILKLPMGLYVLASISLLAGLLGVFSAFFGINVADGAHIGGLVAGVVLAAVWPLPPRLTA